MTADTILLIEDSLDEVELARAAFARADVPHALVVAENGQDGLALLFDSDAVTPRLHNLRLVLLDLKLPGLDGFEVLRRIRADPRTRLLPVVVLTSSVEERDVRTSYELGANGYLRKPVDFDDFVPLARKLTEYWLVLNQPPPRPGPAR